MAFGDFAMDLVLLQDESANFNNVRFRKSLDSWIVWVKSHFTEFRLGLASFVDDEKLNRCYTHKTKLSDNYSSVLSQLEKLPWKKTNKTTTHSLTGSVDALMDETLGWNYAEVSPKGKYQIRLAVVITDKGPMLKGSFSDRPAWTTTAEPCGQTDAPDAAALGTFMWDHDFHTLALVAGDDKIVNAWDTLGHHQGDGGPYFTMFGNSSATSIPLDEAFLKMTACEAWRNEALTTVSSQCSPAAVSCVTSSFFSDHNNDHSPSQRSFNCEVYMCHREQGDGFL